ncbi:alpha/beta hydrolase fold [Heliomicrobium modesticaldum Ice1]|uniref:Alpha/beta hydrolase fold n=1 Tax=Heliobacterium modesticaldum (strain ATCC 51547 / Ice1) TaxID=498761 RepID=B0TFC8_HELMI|nr:alpha/beta hydrolase [Heliomicrobium modesticaldum]ABZ84445.1 alpha/beta hydrolase fold [Heliomicrobium modesticaldum Ice1]
MQPERREVTLPGIRLSYLEWKGEGTEPILLLHGLGDHALIWVLLAERLADRFHIIAPDMRGHGESDKPGSGYTFRQVIADMENLMDHLGWSDAHILGHSWTGKLAPIWAREHKERFRSMILVDPIFIVKMPAVMKLSFPILFRVLDSLKGMGPFRSYAEAETLAKSLRQYQGWSAHQQRVFREGLERKPDGRWGSKFVVPARNQIFDDVMRVAGLTEPITVPTLFVQPEKGVNRADFQMKPYITYLKNLEVRRIAGNHWPMLVEPEIFNRTIEDFLMKRLAQKKSREK